MEFKEKCAETSPLCPLGWWIASGLRNAGATSFRVGTSWILIGHKEEEWNSASCQSEAVVRTSPLHDSPLHRDRGVKSWTWEGDFGQTFCSNHYVSLQKKIAWCSKTVMAWDYLNRSYFISLKWMQITELGRSPFLQFLEFCGFAYLLYTCYLPCWWIKQALYFLFYRPDQWWKILPMDGLRERVAGLGFQAGFLHPAYFLSRSYSVLFPPTLPASFLLLRPSALDMTLSP